MRLKLSKDLIWFFLIAMVSMVSAQSNNNTSTGKDFTYIDTHNHLSGGPMRRSDYSGATRNALAEMDELGIQKIFIMPPPFSPGHRGIFEIDDFLPVTGKYPERISILGGCGSLNVMIH